MPEETKASRLDEQQPAKNKETVLISNCQQQHAILFMTHRRKVKFHCCLYHIILIGSGEWQHHSQQLMVEST